MTLLRTVFLLILGALPLSLSATQLRQIAILDIPGRPGFDQAVFAHGMLVIAHQASDTLDIFDPARRRVVAQVKGMSQPHGLVFDADSGKVYVANAGNNTIAVVSSQDWKVERTIAVTLAPYDLVLVNSGKRLVIGNWEQRSVSAIDLVDGEKVATADLNGSPAGLALDPASQTVYASLQDASEVAAIDASSLRVVKRYKLAASQPTAILWDAAARRLYVAVRHAVLSLDADTGKELGRAAAPAGTDGLWLDPSAGMLYVASAGGYIDTYRTGGNNLRFLEEVHTEVRGHSVAFDPSRQLVFLPGGREGRSKILILKQLGSSQAEQVAAK